MVNYYAIIKIYQNINDTFVLFQELANYNGNRTSYGGAITDDHELVAFATAYIYQVYVFKFNGSKYELNQTIPFNPTVYDIAITPDHSLMAVI